MSIREEKHQENNIKANEARYNKSFFVEINGKGCEFDTSIATQTDLLMAFIVCQQTGIYKDWFCNNGEKIDLTTDIIIAISSKFNESSNIYDKWLEYKNRIDNAQSESELNNIEINYY